MDLRNSFFFKAAQQGRRLESWFPWLESEPAALTVKAPTLNRLVTWGSLLTFYKCTYK